MANPITLAHIIERLETRQVGRGYRAQCPAHRGDNPSALVINEGEDGKVLLYCHAHNCTYEDILRALGLWDASATSSTGRRTGYTKPPKTAKLTEDEKIIGVTACREAMGLLCGPLPDHPNDPELIPPYGAFLEDLWAAYTETGSHEGVQAAYIAMRPALAEAMPKLLRALDQRLKDKMGQPLPSLESTLPPPVRGKKLKDLMAKVFPQSNPVVPEVILEGSTVFAGKPKLGKSRVMLDISIAIATGGKALGVIPVDPGPVLYLSLEDPERRLQSRARAMLMDCNAPDFFDYEDTWPRANEGGLEELRRWLDTHPGAKLVVIDTLKRFRPKPERNQSAYDLDYEALQHLTDMSHQYPGLAIVVVHHTNKQREVEDFMDLISGTAALPGAADGFAVMRRKRGEEDATIEIAHRDLEQDQSYALKSDQLTGGWTFLGPSTEQATSPEQRAILSVLRDALEPMDSKTIADILSKHRGAVRFLLWKMENAGLVERVGTGKYVLPDSTHIPTNNANSAKRDNNANIANRGRTKGVSDVVSGVSGMVNGANRPQAAPVVDPGAPVSVVSDISGCETHETRAHCEECGGIDIGEHNGRLICNDCARAARGIGQVSPGEGGPRPQKKRQCLECGQWVTAKATGRPGRFCSTTCRARAWRVMREQS